MATTAAGSVDKKKPVFVKVDSLKPGTNGYNLTVKVIISVPIKSNGGSGSGRRRGGRCSMSLNSRFAAPQHIDECLMGDETRIIVYTACNDQVDTMAPGNTVIIRNAKIDMFKGSMCLVVDKWGRVEVAAEPASFDVKEDNNLSLVKYELVNVEVNE